jgi:hypothetical protein
MVDRPDRRRVDERAASADSDHQARDRGVTLVAVYPRNNVHEGPNILPGLVADRTADDRRQRDDAVPHCGRDRQPLRPRGDPTSQTIRRNRRAGQIWTAGHAGKNTDGCRLPSRCARRPPCAATASTSTSVPTSALMSGRPRIGRAPHPAVSPVSRGQQLVDQGLRSCRPCGDRLQASGWQRSPADGISLTRFVAMAGHQVRSAVRARRLTDADRGPWSEEATVSPGSLAIPKHSWNEYERGCRLVPAGTSPKSKRTREEVHERYAERFGIDPAPGRRSLAAQRAGQQ